MALRQDSNPPDWALAGVESRPYRRGVSSLLQPPHGYQPANATRTRQLREQQALGIQHSWQPGVLAAAASCFYHMAEKDHLKAFKCGAAARVVRYAIDPDPTTRSVISFGESTRAAEPTACRVARRRSRLTTRATVSSRSPLSRADGHGRRRLAVSSHMPPRPAERRRTLAELWRAPDDLHVSIRQVLPTHHR